MGKLRLWAAMLVLAAVVNVASADCGECDEGKCDSKCSVTAAMGKLPKITYKVGAESTCCSFSAKTLAEKSGEPITFMVAEKQYDSEGKAMTALADVTEKFVADFAKPSTCQVSGTTTVAGQKLHCSKTAGKLASAMREAMDNVHMTFKVGEEECHCPNQAKALAEESGEKTQFVIGSESTCCSIDARVKLAQAKYRAALEVLAKLQSAEKEEVATASTEIVTRAPNATT